MRDANIIVAVKKSMALKAGSLPAEVPTFKNRILLRDVMSRLEAFRKVTGASKQVG